MPASTHHPTTNRRPTRILAPSGQPAGFYLYPSPRSNPRQYRPRGWLSSDTKQNVSSYDRAELVNYSRQLFAQVGNLSTAIKQKNLWAFGDAWEPIYLGRNQAWGEEATTFLKEQFFPMCNVRGPAYHFKRSLTISGQLWDVDGDDLMVLTESPSGFPQLAFFPSTRIASQSMARFGRGSTSGTRGENTVDGGPYDGAKIHDGIIYDRNMRMIAVRLVNEDPDASEYTDISSYNCDLAYLPDWHDQGRGIPRIATCLLRWMNLQDIDEFLQRGMKRASSIGLINKSEDGEAGTGNEIITEEETTSVVSGAATQIAYEEVNGGEMYYLSAASGESLEALKYDNPHPNSEAFVTRLMRESVASVGWLFELLNLSETGRAPTRAACALANQSIWSQQESGLRRARRATVYAIAKAMKSGFLSRNNDGPDPYRWEFGLPAPLSVDEGNDEAADRDNLKLGTVSKGMIAAKKGYHRKEIERQREDELNDLCEMARRISMRNPELSFDRALEMLEQRSPNPVTQAQPAQQQPMDEQ